MLWLTVGLAFIGLFLIYLEFFLPGGIPASFGSIILIGSLVTFFYEFNSYRWLFAYLGLLIVFVVLTCFLALSHIRSTGGRNSFYLKADQKGFYASSYDKSMLDKEGVALTPLRLSGHILIEGKQHQALARSRFIKKGQPVQVIGGRGSYLIVKAKEDV